MHSLSKMLFSVAVCAFAFSVLGEDAAPAAPPFDPPRWDFGYQTTTITQTVPSFRDPYEGPKSFREEGSGEFSTTLTVSIFTDLRLWKNAWVSVDPEASGVVKLLGYANHGRMGSYAQALAEVGSGIPDIFSTRARGRTKRGLGLNL